MKPGKEKIKSYLKTVCVVYTCLVLGKVILENVTGRLDGSYGTNFLIMFLIACLATVVLDSYGKLQEFPLIPVIIGQYLVVIGLVLGCVFLADRLGLTEITKSGYLDLFFSVTVPYVIGAIVYYVSFFQEIRKANRMIREMQYTKQR